MMEVSSKLFVSIKPHIGGVSGDVRREKMCIRIMVEALGECEINSEKAETEQLKTIY